MKKTQLLIVGSGPYGLSAAAYARNQGVDCLILGKTMDFWNTHMPKGMFLRSGPDWHMDPLGVYTFSAFLGIKGLKSEQVSPIPVELFWEYGRWFADSTGLQVMPSLVRELGSNEHGFEAVLDDGSRILAKNVLAAPGFRYFANVPETLANTLPRRRYTHTCELVQFDSLRGKRCLILGGRQSAFEWAALIAEAGATEVHLVYRHDTPRFEGSDWNWVDAMMDLTLKVRGWFRRLPKDEQSAIERSFWAEGRLKLEPWLAPRIAGKQIVLWPRCSLHACQQEDDGTIAAQLDTGQILPVDHVILATGYRVNMENVPYLSRKTVLPRLSINEGFPALDEDFQTSISGLYMAGLMATKDFGPFYGFVRGCPTAARIIVDRIISGGHPERF